MSGVKKDLDFIDLSFYREWNPCLIKNSRFSSFLAEKVSSLGKDWHRGCLKCTRCGKTLTSGGHAEVHCLFPINLSCATVYLLKFGIWRICQKLIETGGNLYEIHHLIIIIKFPLTLLQHAKINIYLWTFWLPFVANYFEMCGVEYFAPFSQSEIRICTFHAIKQ